MPKYADIAKPAKDVLGDDYTTSFTLKAKKNAGPVAVTIETEQGKDGALTSKVGTKFSYAKFNVDKGQLKADGGKVLETSIKLTPDVQLAFKASKGADLCVDYAKGGFYGTGVLDVMGMSKVATSACYALPSGLTFGGDATYSLSGSSGLTGYSAGASYKTGPVFASLTTSKFSTYNIGLVYKVNKDLSLASQTIHSSEKVCDVLAIGGSFAAPNIGTIKAKVSGGGILSACLVREIAPKVMLTASGTVSTSDLSSFKPGLALSM